MALPARDADHKNQSSLGFKAATSFFVHRLLLTKMRKLWNYPLFCLQCTYRYCISDAHFRWSPVIDRLKSPKTDCSNTLQDLGLIKIQFWWSPVPLFLWCRRQACHYFPTRFKPRSSAENRRVDQCIWTAEAPCFGWSKWPCIAHGQRSFCFFFVGSTAEPKVNSRSGATSRQPFQDWLSVMQTSTFPLVHNHEFCFLQVWCPTVFASLGHRVQLKFGIQDTLSYKVLKKVQHCCIHVYIYHRSVFVQFVSNLLLMNN